MSGPHSLPFGISGIGVALPPHVRTNAFWADKLTARTDEQKRGDVLVLEHDAGGNATKLPESIARAMEGFDDIYRGAVNRRVLDDDVELSDLEAESVRAALSDARVDPRDIDLLLVHSLPNDYATPLNAAAVQQKAGLEKALAWNLEVGCGSFQAQLLAASGMLASGLFQRAVIVQSAAMSRIMDFRTPMSVGFGDGAVAAVVSRLPDGYGLVGSASATDGSLRDAIVLGPTCGPKGKSYWWRGEGPSVLFPLDAHLGKSVGLSGPEFCRATCMAALDDARLPLSEIDWFVCTQSVGWFVDACRRELGLPSEKTIDTFRDVANIGAGAILYNLETLRKKGALKDGQTLLLYAPSAGFTRSAVVIRWREPRG